MSQEVEYYQDKAGEWRWRVVAPNGRVIADSGEGYKNRTDAEHGYGLLDVRTVPIPKPEGEHE